MRRIHRPLQDRASGEDDAVRAQPRARMLHEILNVEVLDDLPDDPLAQPGVDFRIKRTPPEVLSNVALVVAFRIPSDRPRECDQRGEVELATEVAQDGRRDLRIVGEEPSMLPQHTQLHGYAAQVLRTTMVGEDKRHIALGEGPIEGQFFIGRMRWHEDRRARRGVLEDAGPSRELSRRRH